MAAEETNIPRTAIQEITETAVFFCLESNKRFAIKKTEFNLTF
jgi:hypothetical protein